MPGFSRIGSITVFCAKYVELVVARTSGFAAEHVLSNPEYSELRKCDFVWAFARDTVQLLYTKRSLRNTKCP
jgi:hypothetical protein